MQAREREIDKIELAPVVRRSDNAIDRINLYPVDEEKLDVKLCHFMQYDFQVYMLDL